METNSDQQCLRWGLIRVPRTPFLELASIPLSGRRIPHLVTESRRHTVQSPNKRFNVLAALLNKNLFKQFIIRAHIPAISQLSSQPRRPTMKKDVLLWSKLIALCRNFGRFCLRTFCECSKNREKFKGFLWRRPEPGGILLLPQALFWFAFSGKNSESERRIRFASRQNTIW